MTQRAETLSVSPMTFKDIEDCMKKLEEFKVPPVMVNGEPHYVLYLPIKKTKRAKGAES